MPATAFIMSDLISNTIMSIVWGILISSLLTSLLFFVPGMLYNRYIGRRVGWIVGGITILVLFLLSSANKQCKNMELLRQSSIYTGGF